MHSRDTKKCLPNAFVSRSDPELLTSKSNQFIFVPNCTELVKSVNSRKQLIRYFVNILSVMDTCTDRPKNTKFPSSFEQQHRHKMVNAVSY